MHLAADGMPASVESRRGITYGAALSDRLVPKNCLQRGVVSWNIQKQLVVVRGRLMILAFKERSVLNILDPNLHADRPPCMVSSD